MTYQEQRDALIADMRGKMHREDWHGVADAANDLRELEAEWRGRVGREPSCAHQMNPYMGDCKRCRDARRAAIWAWVCGVHGVVPCHEFASKCPACESDRRERQS